MTLFLYEKEAELTIFLCGLFFLSPEFSIQIEEPLSSFSIEEEQIGKMKQNWELRT